MAPDSSHLIATFNNDNNNNKHKCFPKNSDNLQESSKITNRALSAPTNHKKIPT